MNRPLDAADRFELPPGSSVQTTLREQNLRLNGLRGIVTVRTLDDGEDRDLTWVPSEATEVHLIRRGSPDGLAVLRHSTAHILAQAVQNLFPGVRLGAGPAIENGFYYDFMTDRPFEADDLPAIEAEMRRLIGEKQTFRRRLAANLSEIHEELRDEPLKLELIDDRQWDFDRASARARHRRTRRFRPDAHCGCLLAGERAPSAVAAYLWNGVPRPEVAQGIPRRAQGAAQLRPPTTRCPAVGICPLSPVGWPRHPPPSSRCRSAPFGDDTYRFD